MQEILNILSSVGFNWHVALANFFNFLIILFLLNKFFFKKLGKTINERHALIEKGLNEAKEAELALANAEEEKRTIIASAKKERESIVANGQALAKEVVTSLTDEANAAIAGKMLSLDEKEKDLERKVEKAFSEKAPSLVALMFQKTLMKEMTEAENNALVERMKA